MVFIIAQQTDYVGKLLLPREPYWRSYGIVFSLLSVRRSRSRCFQYMYYLYWIAFLHCWKFSRSFLLSGISFNDNFIFSTFEPAIHNSDRFQRISEFINIEIKSVHKSYIGFTFIAHYWINVTKLINTTLY